MRISSRDFVVSPVSRRGLFQLLHSSYLLNTHLLSFHLCLHSMGYSGHIHQLCWHYVGTITELQFRGKIIEDPEFPGFNVNL